MKKRLMAASTTVLLFGGVFAGCAESADSNGPTRTSPPKSETKTSTYEVKLDKWLSSIQPELTAMLDSLELVKSDVTSASACVALRDDSTALLAEKDLPTTDTASPAIVMDSYSASNTYNLSLLNYQLAAEACLDGDYKTAQSSISEGKQGMNEVTDFIMENTP